MEYILESASTALSIALVAFGLRVCINTLKSGMAPHQEKEPIRLHPKRSQRISKRGEPLRQCPDSRERLVDGRRTGTANLPHRSLGAALYQTNFLLDCQSAETY